MEALKMETCSHESLLELDQSYGYTAVANEVMMHIIANPIIASASRLWILIRFQQSGFYDREYIERTISWFAKKLNVSTSSIQKWQRLLEREGYLEIIERKYQTRNNRPNRYRACLPKSVADQLKAHDMVYTAYTEEVKPPCSDNKEAPAVETSTESTTEQNEFKTKITVADLQPMLEEAPDWLKLLIPGLHLEIVGDTLWITGVNSIARTEMEKRRDTILTYLNQQGFHLSALNYNNDQKTTLKPTSTQAGRPTPQSKEQRLYSHTQHRIYKRLLSLSINGHQLQASEAKRLCAEVVFAIEKGSLATQPKLMGINIALKLIRENRWRTPAGYTQGGQKA